MPLSAFACRTARFELCRTLCTLANLLVVVLLLVLLLRHNQNITTVPASALLFGPHLHECCTELLATTCTVSRPAVQSQVKDLPSDGKVLARFQVQQALALRVLVILLYLHQVPLVRQPLTRRALRIVSESQLCT